MTAALTAKHNLPATHNSIQLNKHDLVTSKVSLTIKWKL